MLRTTTITALSLTILQCTTIKFGESFSSDSSSENCYQSLYKTFFCRRRPPAVLQSGLPEALGTTLSIQPNAPVVSSEEGPDVVMPAARSDENKSIIIGTKLKGSIVNSPSPSLSTKLQGQHRVNTLLAPKMAMTAPIEILYDNNEDDEGSNNSCLDSLSVGALSIVGVEWMGWEVLILLQWNRITV